MEFNPDGSLKLSGSAKKKETKATLQISSLPDNNDGKHILITLQDGSLPYNLIEGHFHEVNSKDDSDCDATLSKKTDVEYDIVVSGPGFQHWVDAFSKNLADYLDGGLKIEAE